MGLFVAEADPDDEEGLFLSLLSEPDEPAILPLPFPEDVFPKIYEIVIVSSL